MISSIYCCGCKKRVQARLTTGREIYPHRSDLRDIPFWKCDACQNYIGCHHKSRNKTQPLGSIPTAELRNLRTEIHKTLDPLWVSGKHSRKDIYQKLSKLLGYEYHTGEVRSVEEAKKVLVFLSQLT